MMNGLLEFRVQNFEPSESASESRNSGGQTVLCDAGLEDGLDAGFKQICDRLDQHNLTF